MLPERFDFSGTAATLGFSAPFFISLILFTVVIRKLKVTPANNLFPHLTQQDELYLSNSHELLVKHFSLTC